MPAIRSAAGGGLSGVGRGTTCYFVLESGLRTFKKKKSSPVAGRNDTSQPVRTLVSRFQKQASLKRLMTEYNARRTQSRLIGADAAISSGNTFFHVPKR